MEIMVTQAIDLKLRGIRIYNDSELQLGVIIPQESSDLSESVTKGLEELGWNDTGSRYKGNEDETAVFTKKHYPIQESVTVTCGGNCSDLVTSVSDPINNRIEGRLVKPATVINSKDTPLQCKITEESITCGIPASEKTTDPTGSIAPRYRYFSIRETDEFKGNIFIDDQVMVDDKDNITDYWTWIRYTPERDGSGFKKSELSKLKKIMSKVITDKL